MNTIFDTLTIDRSKCNWYSHVLDLTPVEEVGGVLFKREDYFAPLGYGGINGTKLKACLLLTDDYVHEHHNPIGVISGTSVRSPQLIMGSAIAMHYKLDTIHVIGATKPATAINYESVAGATWFGAKFHIIPNIAYNPVLQRRIKEMLTNDEKLKDYFYLEYGITRDHTLNSPKKVEEFHRMGSEQVRNIPDHVERLIVPAGSCNSTTSILYGLARFPKPNLKDVYLIGIGPNKLRWVEERLDILENVSGVYCKPFRRNYVHSSDIQQQWDSPDDLSSFMDVPVRNAEERFTLHHYDLHSTGVYEYSDLVDFNYHGIEFHPTYEAKVATWVTTNLPEIWNDKSCFWIVGSRPTMKAMEPVLKDELGAFPDRIREYHYAKP